MLKQMSLRSKLISGFAFVSLFVVVVGAISYYSLHQVIENYSHIANVNLPNAIAISKIRVAQKDIVIAASTMLGSHATPEEIKNQSDYLENAVASFEKASKDYEDIPFVEGEEKDWIEVKEIWGKLLEKSRKIIELSKVGSAAAEKERDQIGKNEYVALRKQFQKEVIDIMDLQEKETVVRSKKAQDTAEHSNITIALMVIVGFVFAVLIGMLISRALSSVLLEISKQLSVGSSEMASASHQIAATSDELSAGATEQAASLQETSASVTEISAMISKNATNAKESDEIFKSNQQKMDEGKRVISEMINAINAIDSSNSEMNHQIEESNREIAKIVDVIRGISDKTKVINDIVFQTKLLSFNASVEAARAGEQGKGFAVVAEEVGNLAQMSGNAAKEITQMLEQSTSHVENIVQSTRSKVDSLVRTGKEKVSSGNQLAHRCGEVFQHINYAIDQARIKAEEISVASNEQAQGVTEINRAMDQLNIVTQQNATASQQSSDAANQLSMQADLVAKTVDRLIETVEGQNSKRIA